MSDDPDDITDVGDLLRRTTARQTASELNHLRKERLFYFRATAENRSRSYKYAANVKEPSARVVSYYPNKKDLKRPGYVRHHAATLRFERLADEWFVVTDPTFYFTRNGYQPHPYPEALLAGKKNAAIRGQVIMWQHLLVTSSDTHLGLFDLDLPKLLLGFQRLPLLELSRAVPEDSWTRTDPRAKDMQVDLFAEGLAA